MASHHGQARAVAPAGDRAPAGAARADAAPKGRCRSRTRAAPGRPAAQFPLLRQPAEISAVRQHLLGEMGGGEPRRARARQHPSAPAGGARVRRRRRRRLGADARDALDARPLPAHAVLRGRQGDQPRGHPPHLAEDGGPLLRASADRAGAHQPRLCGRAVARGEIAERRVQHGVARGAAHRHRPRTSSNSRSSISSRSSPRTGRRASARRPATRSTSGRWCW